MSHGDDLDIVKPLAEDDRKMVAAEDYAAGSVEVGRTNRGMAA